MITIKRVLTVLSHATKGDWLAGVGVAVVVVLLVYVLPCLIQAA